MTFDKTAFVALLEEIAETTYALPGAAEAMSDIRRSPFMLSITGFRDPARQIDVECDFYLRDKENGSFHDQIAARDFVQARIRDGHTLEALLRDAVPALATHEVGFRFDLVKRKGKDESRGCFRYQIGPYNTFRDACPPAEIADYIARLAKNLDGLPANMDRRFRVNNSIEIPAATPEDAMRVHLALTDPGLFDRWPENVPDLKIHEVIDTAKVLNSIFEN